MRRRALSQDLHDYTPPTDGHLQRRPSIQNHSLFPKEFVINVEKAKESILRHEDTNNDFQVTVEDTGPKLIRLGSAASEGWMKTLVHGNYQISTLLQELASTSESQIILNETLLHEDPVSKLYRMIVTKFWPSLIRRLDEDGIEAVCMDSKIRHVSQGPRIYVPSSDPFAFDYYQKAANTHKHLNLDVVQLPSKITPQYAETIRSAPGALSLALMVTLDGDGNSLVRGVPFVVPGGRFNEMYGWDSYFCLMGLLEDSSKKECSLFLAKSLVDNLVYEITHYGKILNANRSYYLTRSQPPFLTSMIMEVYESSKLNNILRDVIDILWLKNSLEAAIREYDTVWMVEPRFVEKYGLSRYYDEGIGIPIETEASHYDGVLKNYALKHNMTVPEFIEAFNDRQVFEPELDEYFRHDRALRESGHDTTYRLEGRAANLLTVDLNSLLYKYEVDIASATDKYFDGQLISSNGEVQISSIWKKRAEVRKLAMYKYLWDSEQALWFDFDIKENTKSSYESVTTFWTLWAGLVEMEDAKQMISKSLKLFEMPGGLVAGTERSLGTLSLKGPNRQWDYPYGWAPHQMLAWEGLKKYGFHWDAKRIAYRWLYMITKIFKEFNAVVPEKFDVVKMTHKISVEYGNVGTDFQFVPKEGFGWMNASYQLGLTFLNRQERRALGLLIPPEKIFHKHFF